MYEFRLVIHKEKEFDNLLYYSNDRQLTSDFSQAMVFDTSDEAELFVINNYDMLENIVKEKGYQYKISFHRTVKQIFSGSDTLFHFLKEKLNGNLSEKITMEDFKNFYREHL